MAYTVKELSEISGVTVRTLHYYDEIGLLKPAYRSGGGYRHYEEEQLLRLQQILFFREVGFELKKIQAILGRPDFDVTLALRSHRKKLQVQQTRTQKLIRTIDKTIRHITRKKTMAYPEMYEGFSKEQQAKYEQELIERFGEKTRVHIEEAKARAKEWSKDQWKEKAQEAESIMDKVVDLMEEHSPDSPEVQAQVRRHFEWLKQFWTPDQESYIGHSQLIADSDLRKWYDKFHQELADYFAKAMCSFAMRELS